jgi:hypothetical protein
MDTAFVLFILAAALIVLAVLVALPSGARIARDPSTAYGGGRRALVLGSAGLGLVAGALLLVAGSSLSYKDVVGGANMLHVGGASLLLLSVVVVIASWRVARTIATAAAGHEEEVLHVEGYSIPPTLAAAAPPADAPPSAAPPPAAPPAPRPAPRPAPSPRDPPWPPQGP